MDKPSISLRTPSSPAEWDAVRDIFREYAAALGRWMGLSAGELATVLPNLGSFNAAPLGFV